MAADLKEAVYAILVQDPALPLTPEEVWTRLTRTLEFRKAALASVYFALADLAKERRIRTQMTYSKGV